MPSSFSHAMVAVTLGCAVAPRPLVRPFVIVGAVSAVAPDLDAIGRWWYGLAGDLQILGGHRGFTHSFAYAALCGAAAALITRHRTQWDGARVRLAVYVALATAAHGVLDMFTTVGAMHSPVQLFSPFDTTGYLSPWQPIHGVFTEIFLLLIPLILLTGAICYWRGIEWPRRQKIRSPTLDLS